MIYYCADDYGLNAVSSMRIKQCIADGVLNKISVFPNIEETGLDEISSEKNIRICLHLNLVEGLCMTKPDEIKLLADPDGKLKHTFGGLFKLSVFKRKELEAQLYKEIRAQVLHWKNILPDGSPFFIDSHQHTHMIPSVFKVLIKVLKDEKINAEYIRIPAEPLLPFITTPSLYFTYSPINLIKQWLLKFLWLINKNELKRYPIPTAYFFGILFSGKMDEKRVGKVLPKYIKIAKKQCKDIEVLFHPGYLRENEAEFQNKNIVFEDFYFSENRKTEFDCVMKISERSVT